MRRRRADKKEITPDVKYNSELVAKLINMILRRGGKSKAQSIVYEAMGILSKNHQGADPLEVFMQALDNVKPLVVLKSRRVGGANYQIPVTVKTSNIDFKTSVNDRLIQYTMQFEEAFDYINNIR